MGTSVSKLGDSAIPLQKMVHGFLWVAFSTDPKGVTSTNTDRSVMFLHSLTTCCLDNGQTNWPLKTIVRYPMNRPKAAPTSRFGSLSSSRNQHLGMSPNGAGSASLLPRSGHVVVDLNPFVSKRPFFANKKVTFANLSRIHRRALFISRVRESQLLSASVVSEISISQLQL